MGKIICTKHGTTGIEVACSHIVKAFSSNIKININTINEKILGAHWVCPDCLDIYKKNVITEEFLNGFLGSLKPICCLCFREWKESFNIAILEAHNFDIDSL